MWYKKTSLLFKLILELILKKILKLFSEGHGKFDSLDVRPDSSLP